MFSEFGNEDVILRDSAMADDQVGIQWRQATRNVLISRRL
jgi:hypothetical protein